LTSSIKPTNAAAIVWRVFGCVVISFVFVFTVYRARVQSIAHDEALAYDFFLEGSISKLLIFNTTNHVLFTIMARFFVKIFGLSELSIRAASVMGAAGYLTFTYLLCRKLFGEGALFLLSVALLCLNPLLMDFMAAARGYGLGAAFLAASMYFLARLVDRGTDFLRCTLSPRVFWPVCQYSGLF
jgi:uncharacterized membrane protein